MSHNPPSPDRPTLVAVKFAAAVLVCGDCERRDNGPKKLHARDVRKLLKHEMGGARVRTRIVQSSCLGLCPRKAMALVAIQPAAPVQAAEVKSDAEVAAFGAAMAQKADLSRP